MGGNRANGRQEHPMQTLPCPYKSAAVAHRIHLTLEDVTDGTELQSSNHQQQRRTADELVRQRPATCHQVCKV